MEILICVVTSVLFHANKDAQYVVRISPTEFFSGDLKRLKYHHDFLSADCFAIEIEGSVSVRPEVQMWCEGKRVDVPKYGYQQDRGSKEISFTIKQYSRSKPGSDEYEVCLGGAYYFRRVLEEPKPIVPSKTAFGPIMIRKRLELRPGADSAVIWAMGSGKGISLNKQDDVMSEVKQQAWVIILRVHVDP